MSERESDLKSFPNESVSSTYDAPNDHVSQFAVEREISSNNHTVQGDLERSLARARLENCQAELDRKDDICQQQAMKIAELNQTVEELKSELREITSYASEHTVEQTLSLRYSQMLKWAFFVVNFLEKVPYFSS